MDKRAKYAVLRYKGRKYPNITIIYTDQSTRAITVRADLKTAERLHTRIKKEIALGTFDIDNYAPKSKDRGISIQEFIGRYLEYRDKLVKIDQLSGSTYLHDKFALDLLISRLDGSTIINNLASDDVINFMVLLKDSDNKKGKPFKPGAINSHLKHIKAAFNWAVKEKLILESPFKDTGLLHDPNDGIYRHIGEADIEKIRKYLQNKPEWQLDVFNLGLWTGARRDELFNIKKQSLYVDNIKGEKVPFVRLSGKGRKIRNMPLCVEACKLLDRRVKYLIDLSKQEQILARSSSPTQHRPRVDNRRRLGFLFWEILDSNSITRAFAKVRRDLALEYFNVHALRHSFATYCLKDEVPVTTVKEFLGHRNIKTTLIYAKTDDELKASDIKKVRAR